MRTLFTPFVLALTAGTLIAQPGTWTQRTSLPSDSRDRAMAFRVDGYGYLTGGKDNSVDFPDLYRYDTVGDSWEQRADFPGTPRHGAVAFSAGGKGYLCFGETDVALAEVWSYDPVADSWEQKADFPGGARAGAMTFTVEETVYVGLGFQGDPGQGPNDLWAYDPGADTWTQKADYPGSGRYGLLAFGLNGYGYTGCGGQGLSFYSDFYRYDPVADVWDQLGDYAGGDEYVSVGLTASNQGFVVAGYNYPADLWSYQPATDSWTALADFPNQGGPGGAPKFAAGFSIGNRLYVGTGSDGTGSLYDHLYRYQPLCDPIEAVIVNNTGPICGQGEVEMNAGVAGSGPLSYLWSGLLIQGDNTLQTISALQVTPGDQVYTVTVSNACSTVEGSTTVTMTEPPMGQFNYNYLGMPTDWCTSGGEVSMQNVYNWVPGGVFFSPNGAVVDEVSGAVDASATGAGSFTVYYQLPAQGGCDEYFTGAGISLFDPNTWYNDQDGDGAGDPASAVTVCEQPFGTVGNGDDQCPIDPDKIGPGSCGCGNPEPGTACDDGLPGTENDVIGSDCICAGGGGCVAPSDLVITNEGPICGQGEVAMSVTALGTGPFTYEWTGLLIQTDPTLPDISALQVVAGDQVYSVTVTNACGTASGETTVTMTDPPISSFNYNYLGMPTAWCTSEGPVSVQNLYNWVGGGTYSSADGAVVDAETGEVDAALSGAGNPSVTYSLPAQGGCAEYSTTAFISLIDPQLWYADQDGDGAGDPDLAQLECEQPFATVNNGDDLCPFDNLKIEPGVCGCGNLEPGAPCDDGNEITINDVVGTDCICMGEGPQAIATSTAHDDRVRYDRPNGTIYVREDARTPVALIDATGRIVSQASGPVARFNVAPLPMGLYFIRASGLSQRVVVE